VYDRDRASAHRPSPKRLIPPPPRPPALPRSGARRSSGREWRRADGDGWTCCCCCFWRTQRATARSREDGARGGRAGLLLAGIHHPPGPGSDQDPLLLQSCVASQLATARVAAPAMCSTLSSLPPHTVAHSCTGAPCTGTITYFFQPPSAPPNSYRSLMPQCSCTKLGI